MAGIARGPAWVAALGGTIVGAAAALFVSDLVRRPTRPGPGSAAAGDGALTQVVPLTQNRSPGRTNVLYEAARAKHERSTRNLTWAERAEAILRADIARLPDTLDFELSTVDCRASTCAVRFASSSYFGAIKNAKILVHGDYSLSCTRHISLPEPTDRGARYETAFMLECR